MNIIDWDKIDEESEYVMNPVVFGDYYGLNLDSEDIRMAGFDLFAKSYLRCADVLLIDFLNDPSDICEPGVIFRACVMAVELKMKSLVGGTGHDLNKLLDSVCKQWLGDVDAKQYVNFIDKMNNYAKGSQTGRYPISVKGDILGREQDGDLYIRIGRFVHLVHELFENYFDKLTIRKGQTINENQ